MAKVSKTFKFFVYLIILVLLAVILISALSNLLMPKTIRELLAENKLLKEAITNLTQEDQIGYAKVISKENKNGKVYTTIKFVETARDDKLKRILEKNYTIEGDVVNFDALIVKFTDKMVMDGKQKSIYLWRRIYGEKTSPENGFAIEQAGQEPARYADMLQKLRMKDRKLFWSNIWQLANDKEKLKDYGIEAIYGNAVYQQLKEGLIYVFKVSSAGQVYPEVVPEM
jgi:cell division protein FtsL